jgi:hypothetical protein
MILFDGIYEDNERKSGRIFNDDLILFDGIFLENTPSEGIFYYDNGVKLGNLKVLVNTNLVRNEEFSKERYLVGNDVVLYHDDGSLKFNGDLLKEKSTFNSKLKIDSIFIENIEYKIKYGKGAYYDRNKLFPKFEFDFYDNEKKKEIKEYNNQNILILHSCYNSNGRLVSEKDFYNNGTIKNSYTYNEGELESKVVYYNNNIVRYKVNYTNSGVMLTEYYNTNQKMYEGEANIALKFNGLGKLYLNTGELKYDGNFVNSKFQGRGILYQNGVKIYDGEFENDVYWGSGISYYEISENIEYDGEWVNGFKHGQGTLYSDSQEIVYSGLFHNNEIQMN